MEDGIIYTFGSLDTLVLVLEGLALLFDSGTNQFFASGSGLGVGVGGTLAAMLALLGTIGNYITQQKLPVHGPLVGLVVYAIIAVPKIDRIFVSDLYTGETVSVSNVPVGVAVIGVGMSTITYNIIKLTEASYSTATVGGVPFESGLSSQNGFMSPMKTLYKLRENLMPVAPGHLVYNIYAYSRYCLYASQTRAPAGQPFRAAGDKWNPDIFRTSTLPFTNYFLNENLIEANLMSQHMDPTTGSESFQRCSVVRDTLSADANGGIEFFLGDSATFGSHLLTQLATSDEAMLAKCGNGTCLDSATAITNTQQLIGQILGGAAQAKSYIQSRMAADFNKLIVSSPSLNSDSLANYASISREAIESVRLAEVLEGETFLRFMVPAMNFILFIFYAMFPIAMIIMITKGVESFKYLAGYLLIGIWGYSWMPVASVINFITISGIAESLNSTRNMLGLNIASAPEMIELAMDQLSTGANLLAATPVITLAIISGALYPLTSVAANSATPSGATGEIAKRNNPPSHSGAPMVETRSQYTDNFGAQDGIVRNRNADEIGKTGSLSLGSTNALTQSSLAQDAHKSEQAWSQTLSSTLSKGKKQISDFNSSNGQSSVSTETKQYTDAGKKILEQSGVDTSEMSQTDAQQHAFETGVNFYAGVEGSADVNAIRSLSQAKGAKLRDPIAASTQASPSSSNSSAPSPATAPARTNGVAPDGQIPNISSDAPSARNAGGLPGINGRLGALANAASKYNQTDTTSVGAKTTAQNRTVSQDEAQTASGAIDTDGIMSELNNSFGVKKEGGAQNLRQLAQQKEEDASQLAAYSNQATNSRTSGRSQNYSDVDLFNAAQQHYKSNPNNGALAGHHEAHVKQHLREHLGDGNEEQVKAAYDFFDGIRNGNSKALFGESHSANSKFLGGCILTSNPIT